MRPRRWAPLVLGCLLAGCGSSASLAPSVAGGAGVSEASATLPRVLILDDHADGRPDLLVRFEYDAAGQLVGRTYDFQGDGSVELSVDGGLPAEDRFLDADSDDDGHVDGFQEVAEGLYVLDDDRDGEAEVTYRELVDADGRVTDRKYDTDADGVTDRTIRWQYD